MVSTQHALLNLAVNEESARYIAHLEKQVLHLMLDNLRCRTVLEILTDESWDDEQFPENAEGLRKIAADAFVKRIGLKPEEAAALVAQRWTTYNPEPVAPETASYLVGPTPGAKAPRRVTTAVPVDSDTPGFDVEKHKRGLEIAKANRQKG